MKSLKILAMVGALGGILLFGTGCNSKEQPIDEKYTGTYTHNGGSIEVTKTTVSSPRGVLLPVLTIDDIQYNPTYLYYTVKWDPTVFNYFSDRTHNFTTYVTAKDDGPNQTTVKGMSYFHGTFGEQSETYTISLIDDHGTTNLFARYKTKAASITSSNDGVEDETYTYDVNPSDDGSMTDLQEDNSSAISNVTESYDSVDDGAYVYDEIPSGDSGE